MKSQEGATWRNKCSYNQCSCKRMLFTLMLCCSVMHSTGCALQTMRTARQLEQGDLVLSGSADVVGTLFIPRVNAQAMYGLGGAGDVSVHGGSSGLLHNAGLGARAYLGPSWTLGAQANALLFRDVGLFSTRDVTIFYNGSFLLSTTAKKKNAFYGGFQLDVYAMQVDRLTDPFEEVWINGGGIVGVDILDHGGLGYQLEAKVTPFYFNRDDGFTVFPLVDRGFDSNILFSAQLGFSIYKRVKTQPLAIAPSESVWLNDVEKEIEERRLNPDLPGTGKPRQEKRRETPRPRKPSPREVTKPGSAPVPPRPD